MNRIVKVWDRILGAVASTSSVAGALCAGAIMAALVLDVAVRTATGKSVVGVYELVQALVVATTFLGLAYTERLDEHVKTKILTSNLQKSLAERVRTTGTFLTLLVLSVLAYSAGRRALASFQIREFRYGLVELPIWPSRLIVAFGFTAMALECLMRFLRRAKRLRVST